MFRIPLKHLNLRQNTVLLLLIRSGSDVVWTVESDSIYLHLFKWLNGIRFAVWVVWAVYIETTHDWCPVNEVLPVRLQKRRLWRKIRTLVPVHHWSAGD